MLKIIAIIGIYGMSLLSKNLSAQEKWFVPVDIGQEIDSNHVKEEAIATDEAQKIFRPDSVFSPEFRRGMEKLKNLWLMQNKDKHPFNQIRPFHIDNEFSIFANVHEFSKQKARIYVMFTYGHSRWHHFYILLKSYLVSRNDFIDKMFSLELLEKKYSFTYMGVGHGTTVDEMVKILGNDYDEDIGQSTDYRNIYYKKHGIYITIQGFAVKYLTKR